MRNPATGERHPQRGGHRRARGRAEGRAGPARAARLGARAATTSARALVRAFRDLLEAEAEECARITTREVGKPIVQSRNEVRAVLERIDWNLEHVGAVIAPRR